MLPWYIKYINHVLGFELGGLRIFELRHLLETLDEDIDFLELDELLLPYFKFLNFFHGNFFLEFLHPELKFLLHFFGVFFGRGFASFLLGSLQGFLLLLFFLLLDDLSDFLVMFGTQSFQELFSLGLRGHFENGSKVNFQVTVKGFNFGREFLYNGKVLIVEISNFYLKRKPASYSSTLSKFCFKSSSNWGWCMANFSLWLSSFRDSSILSRLSSFSSAALAFSTSWLNKSSSWSLRRLSSLLQISSKNRLTLLSISCE